jgi:Domain of unknown function (DUF4375)
MNKNNILIKLSESKNTKFGKEDFVAQSFPQKVFSAIWAAESEINNGGFSQYFVNWSAESAPFVVAAFEAIGALKAADICKRAITVAFPAGLPLTEEAISQAAGDFSRQILGELDHSDKEFYKYPDNVTDLLFTFVLEHPEEFGELPKPDNM